MRSIIFVNPPAPGHRKITRNIDCASESKGNYLLQPFDFLFLSGTFPPEARITFVDAVADRLSAAQCLARITEAQPELIVTAAIDRTWEDDLAFATALRERHPETPILAFGDALIEDRNADAIEEIVDGVILSPYTFDPAPLSGADRAAVQARRAEAGLRAVGAREGAVNKKPRLARPLRPRHSLFLHPAYRWPFASHKRYTTVTLCWGCPYACSYCTCARLPALYRPVDEVLDELSEIARLGVRELYFGDKSFGFLRGEAVAVLEGMLARDLRFSWSTYFHPNQYSPELLDLMKRSGCHTVIVGIESADLGSLARFRRQVSAERIAALLEHAARIRLNVCGDFMLGLPDEDERAIVRTIDYALSLGLDYASFNIVSPLPGSVIKTLAIGDGRMSEHDHHFDPVGKGRILPSNVVGADALERLRNRAVRRFYLRPSYLLRRLSRLRGLEHLEIQVAEMLELLRKSGRSEGLSRP